MNLLTVFYYLLCYGIGFAGFSIALLRWRQGRFPADGWNVAAMGSLTLVTLAMSVNFFLSKTGGAPAALMEILNIAAMAGAAALIAILPRFGSCFSSHRGQVAILRISSALAALLLPAPGLAWALGGLGARNIAAYALFAALALSGAYLIILIAISMRWKAKAASADQRRWSAILPWLTLCGAIALPLIIVNDCLNLPSLVFGVEGLPQAVPLFLAGWNAIYLVMGSGKSAKAGDPGSMDFERFPFTPREREVAALLVSGLSYKEIGAKLDVSAGTVKTHVLNVYGKSGASNKIELIGFLRRQ